MQRCALKIVLVWALSSASFVAAWSWRSSERPLAGVQTEHLVRLLPGGTTQSQWVAEELDHRVNGGLRLSEDMWDAALGEATFFRYRSTWPSSETFVVEVEVPRWTQIIRGLTHIRAVPRTSGLKPFVGPDFSWHGIEASEWLVGMLDPGYHAIVVDIEVSQSSQGKGLSGGVVWTGSREIRVHSVPEAIALSPVSGLHLDELIRRSLSFGYDDDGAYLRLSPGRVGLAGLGRIGVSLEVILVKDDRVVEMARLLLDPTADFSRDLSKVTTRCLHNFRLLPEELQGIPDSWSLRVSGDRTGISSRFDIDRYYSGTFEVSLAELQRG